ncbi:MAG: Large extracellular alpha-helical protein [Myxococcales bacterium]|nr:Large extracellular alpha-helical protein [Myxococcales bacterium]
MKKILLAMVLVIGCHTPPVQAKESATMKDADKLFTEGKYDSALQKYDALQKSPPDERIYTRALFRAIECETLLNQHEKALDRARAAKLPSDPGLRGIVNLGRLEMFRGVQNWYGYSEETEEGAEGSAKMSKPAAEREMEASAQGLWKDREKLARLPLKAYAEFLVLTDVDFPRYPSLWDFSVLRLHEWLAPQRGRVDVTQFAADELARGFEAGKPALLRIGALYEESAHLDGGSVDRAMAGERWRVARVMLATEAQGATLKQREAWHAAAIERLQAWSQKMRTPLGRADAAAKAAALLYATRRVEALKLIEATLPKTPESDVAVELRQLRHNILDKEIGLSTRVTRDGKRSIQLQSRNLATVYLRLYRMDPMHDAGKEFWSQSLISPRYEKVEAWLGGRKPVVEWKVATGDKGDHLDVHQEIDAPTPGVGLYLVVASGDDHFAARRSILRAAFVNVTDIAVARAETEAGLRYYAFNVDTKEPAGDVPFRMLVSTDWRNRTTDETKTNGEGVASWTFPHAPYLQIDAMAVHGKAIALFPSPAYHGTRYPEPPVELFLVGDRPIYRPGQVAKVRVTSVERIKDGSFKIDAKRKIHLVLQDPNGKEVAKADLVTGQMGSASTEFTLPLKGLLGVHNIVATAVGVRDVSRNLSLRVEEYKRPEFEVTLEAPKAAAKYGEKSRLTGSVKYYFGGAAGDVPVKFKVSRQRWIPWWYWRQGQSPKVEIARGDVKTDKTGNFTVEFTAAPDPDDAPSEDPDLPDVSDFIVEVEAHDTGGRTIAADRTLRVGAQSMLVTAESERGFYFSNEAAALKIKVSNLEEQPVAAEVGWEIERLGAPKEKPAEGAPLQALLKKYPAADAHVAHGTLKSDGKGPAALALPLLPAGGYRVRLKAGDARGSFAFLVADAKTRALALTLPPIALAQKAELQPGEKAELLVGASAASGAYHVELWRGANLVEHHVDKGAPVRVWTVAVGQREAGGFTARWIGVDGVDAVGSDITLRVPRKDKELTIKLVGKPEALEPGQSAKWTVEVKDQKGRAVDGEALVTIFDRSLELYAKQYLHWANALWGAPAAPEGRTDGVLTGWGLSLPGDDAAQARAAREIQGHYKPMQTPRFSWEQTSYRGYGYGNARFAMSAAPGALPPPAQAAPVGGVAKRRAAVRDQPDDLLGGSSEEKASNNKADKNAEQKETTVEKPPKAGPELRTNMAETAAFIPDIKVEGGKGVFSFTAPERLTSWRVQIVALGRAVEAGVGDDTFATKKPLMVRVEIPRFFREGDRSTITAVVHNETNAPISANVDLDIVDDASGKPALEALGIKEKSKKVEVPAHGLTAVEFAMVAPENIATYKIRAHATAGKLSDAEERPLPILPSRERLIQSRVVALKGNDKKLIEFAELIKNADPSLRSESLSVSIDPQLALSVLRSIPFLVEYPYECTEQTLNRYVPMAIVNEIYKKHPEIAKAIAAAPHRETEHEAWNKDDPRRMLMLTETPWLQEAEGGSKDWRLRDLLNPKVVTAQQEDALGKLARAQNGSGAFPWFPGGRDDFYMTLYVLEQLAMLQDFGIQPPRDMVSRALGYVGRELPHRIKKDEADVAYLAYGSYVLTSFDPQKYPDAGRLRGEVAAWMKYVLANRQLLTPYGRAWCARVMWRLEDKKLALELLESALDGAKSDPVTGVYWTPERYSWMWYSDTVEKHAFFIRTLNELKPQDTRVAGMLQWLLFNRKGNQWHSTKASAAAVYSILDLMQKMGSLSQPEKFHVEWDKQEEIVTVKPTEDRRTPLMWTVKGRDVTPARGRVQLGKEGPGIAFASATWIYSSTKLQEAHASNLIAIERKYFRKVHQADGYHLQALASGDKVKVGEEIEVRLYIKTKSQFEYVHVKEPRGAGFEETTLVSGWKWDKLSSYQEPRDSLYNFFVDWMPHGEFELRHSLRPTTPGHYRIGSAVLQSMYSPDVTAFTAGMELEVIK